DLNHTISLHDALPISPPPTMPITVEYETMLTIVVVYANIIPLRDSTKRKFHIYFNFVAPSDSAKTFISIGISNKTCSTSLEKIAIPTILKGIIDGYGPKALPKIKRVKGIKLMTNNKYGNERIKVIKKLKDQ